MTKINYTPAPKSNQLYNWFDLENNDIVQSQNTKNWYLVVKNSWDENLISLQDQEMHCATWYLNNTMRYDHNIQ